MKNPRLNRFLGFCVTGLLLSAFSASAAITYLGDGASFGAVLTGPVAPVTSRPDSVTSLTYAFVGAGSSFSATGPQTIVLKDVNFYASNTANGAGAGSITPFIAIFTGTPSTDYGNGANFSVIAIGDSITVAAGSAAQAYHGQFLVGGVAPTLNFTLGAGQVLVTGFRQNVPLVHFLDPSSGPANDFINNDTGNGNGTALPSGALPATLQSSSDYGLNRTFYYNVGFEVIPEPSSALLGAAGLSALVVRRRRF